jgi:hypothetical protein
MDLSSSDNIPGYVNQFHVTAQVADTALCVQETQSRFMDSIGKVGAMAALICFHSCAVGARDHGMDHIRVSARFSNKFFRVATTHNQVDESGLGAPFG